MCQRFAGARSRLLLDLGEVHEVASVSINGRPAGIVWKPPYRLDIGELLVPGRNLVEVTVANLVGEQTDRRRAAG